MLVPTYRELSLQGAWIVEPEPMHDERGWFARYLCMADMDQRGIQTSFVQFNHTATRRVGSIRGMHLQIGAAAEQKFIKCVRGAVIDVLLDLRAGSPTFMQHVQIELSETNGVSVFVPTGVAHGFQTLQPDTELIYHHTNYHTPEQERGVRFDDPRAGIEWPLEPADVSVKDRNWPRLAEDFSGFVIPVSAQEGRRHEHESPGTA